MSKSHDNEQSLSQVSLSISQIVDVVNSSGIPDVSKEDVLISMASKVLGVDFKAIIDNRLQGVLMSYISVPGSVSGGVSSGAVKRSEIPIPDSAAHVALEVKDETGRNHSVPVPHVRVATRQGPKAFRVCPDSVEEKAPVDCYRGNGKLYSMDQLAKMLTESALVKNTYTLTGRHVGSLLRSCQVVFSFAEEQGNDNPAFRGYYRPGSRAKGAYVAVGDKIYGKDGHVYYKDLMYTDAVFQQIYNRAKEIANDGSLAGKNVNLRVFSAIGKQRIAKRRESKSEQRQSAAA